MTEKKNFPPGKGGVITLQQAKKERQAWQKANPNDTHAVVWGIDFLLEHLKQAKANGATAAVLYLAKNSQDKTTIDINFANENGKYIPIGSAQAATTNGDGEVLNDPFLCPPNCPCDPDDPNCP